MEMTDATMASEHKFVLGAAASWYMGRAILSIMRSVGAQLTPLPGKALP